MEHNFTARDGLPMLFIDNRAERQISFATDNLVMPGDTLVGIGIKATVKEVIDEWQSKGDWSVLGHTPTTYKVQLY